MDKENQRNSKLGIEKLKNSSDSLDDIDIVLNNKIDDLLFEVSGSPTKPPNYLRIAVIGIFIISLLVAGVYFLKLNTANSSKQIFAANFETFEDIISDSERGEDAPGEDVLNRAMSLYSAGKFKDAIPLFNKHIQNQNDGLAQFYLAISYLAEHDPRGKEILQKRSKEKTKSDLVDAEIWYLALANLDVLDIEGAIPLFQRIATDSMHYKQEKAKEILVQLNN